VPATPDALRDGAATLRDFLEQYRLEASRGIKAEAPLRETFQKNLVQMLRPCAGAELTETAREWLEELLLAAESNECTWGLIADDALMLAGHLDRAADRAEKDRRLERPRRSLVSVPIPEHESRRSARKS
jgi:hypothetical protein